MDSRVSSLLFSLERGLGIALQARQERRPSSRDDGGVSWVSSGCCAHGGFLTRHDEDLREPLVQRQGSQVSMRMARGSASWLLSHGRGLGPRDALKKDSRGLSRGAAGNPRLGNVLSLQVACEDVETEGDLPIVFVGKVLLNALANLVDAHHDMRSDTDVVGEIGIEERHSSQQQSTVGFEEERRFSTFGIGDADDFHDNGSRERRLFDDGVFQEDGLGDLFSFDTQRQGQDGSCGWLGLAVVHSKVYDKVASGCQFAVIHHTYIGKSGADEVKGLLLGRVVMEVDLYIGHLAGKVRADVHGP